MDVVRAIENQPVEKDTNKPLKPCVIVDCGELKEGDIKHFPSNSTLFLNQIKIFVLISSAFANL
jgi:hypothetical protein